MPLEKLVSQVSQGVTDFNSLLYKEIYHVRDSVTLVTQTVFFVLPERGLSKKKKSVSQVSQVSQKIANSIHHNELTL